MWFQFPQGCERISIERQTFVAEMTDAEGRTYFRAPDHFAPSILGIGGFSIVAKPPDDFPEDLPQADPLRDGAIAGLTKAAEAMKGEIKDLRSDLATASARITALTNENIDLRQKLYASEAVVEALNEQIEDNK